MCGKHFWECLRYMTAWIEDEHEWVNDLFLGKMAIAPGENNEDGSKYTWVNDNTSKMFFHIHVKLFWGDTH